MNSVKIHCKYDDLLDPKNIKNYPKNRNKHPQSQIERLGRMFCHHGIRHPIIIDTDRKVIAAGHGRKLAAIREGLKEFPVVYQKFETEEDLYTFCQADNALTLESELDMAGINEDIGELGPFDLDKLGIPDFTIDVADKFEDKDPDEVPEVVEPVAKLGQIYKLGNHRLMCGDSTDEATVSLLMNGEKADMVFTDPPYGMFLDADYTSLDGLSPKGKSFLGTKGGKKHKQVIGDNEDFKPDLIKIVFEMFGYCKEIFLFGADYYSEHLENKNSGAWVVWDKRTNNDLNIDKALSSDKLIGSSFELCWSKSKHKREIARVRNGIFGVKNESGNSKTVHPTQKPIQLVEWFFDKWGKGTKSVVDIYGGSGSTLIACEKTNRKCFMMELDPHYIDVIIARWEKFTGKKAELLNG